MESSTKKQRNPHAGHRARLREEFCKNGESGFMQEHKLLEMLLFYGIPQRDTNPLAHELIARFGSLAGVLEADVNDLASIKGMTKNAACLIKLILPMARAYIKSKSDPSEKLRTPEDIGRFIMHQYFGFSTEVFSMLCLDREGTPLSFDILADGDIDSVGVSMRTVLEKVMRTSATAVVLAHNHPSGLALPSAADVEITKTVASVLKTISVNLVDHLIIVKGDYVSMAQSARFRDIFE